MKNRNEDKKELMRKIWWKLERAWERINKKMDRSK